jgi:hypothetical protein
LDGTLTLQFVQSVCLIGALSFTAIKMWRYGKQDKFDHYMRFMSIFLESTRLIVERPELQKLYDYSEKYRSLSSEQQARVHYCDLLIGLGEMVWLASRKRILAKDEWAYWRSWLNELFQKSPDFEFALDWCRDQYAREFIDELRTGRPS